MLDDLDMNRVLSDEEYESVIDALKHQMGGLQREVRAAQRPVILLFEGWNASGIAQLCNHLARTLDPRGAVFYSTMRPTREEKAKPFLWRFWRKIPAKGQYVIFDRSWYSRMFSEQIDQISGENGGYAYGPVRSFERQLIDDGTILIKFFLHISKGEQKKRFNNLENDPCLGVYLEANDWNPNFHYKKYLPLIERTLVQTDNPCAPWTIVEANDRNYAIVKVYRTIIRRIQAELAGGVCAVSPSESESGTSLNAVYSRHPLVEPIDFLSAVDLTSALSDDEYRKKKQQCRKRLRDIQYELYRKKIPLVILYEGWDAAGKGGNIARLTHSLNPRGYRVIPVGAPRGDEENYHYFRRFYADLPREGFITIFDRSWYGRVMVERIEGFCTPEEWSRAYREINEFEASLLDWGAIVVKFWLQIDRDEQLSRFHEREQVPYKRWKITPEDWRNREKWELYRDAVNEMIAKTSPPEAPWTLVPANNKHYARIYALQTIIGAAEERLNT